MSDLAKVAGVPQTDAAPLGLEVDSRITVERSRVTVQPMIGPGNPSRLRRCIMCLGEFQAEEAWLRMVPADGGYAIGVHIRCYLASD